ncbi:MAG: cyclic nucleotide-binding domain-containing protein [Candidatus Tritonobacter lacicola]|nr:cyclic nucleotide-binding domain-containing protein [Candidatus Tritonobacter lacicola]
MTTLLLNIAYLLTFVAFLVRDILWLRILLVSSQLSFIAYAILAENISMTAWNIGFVLVNFIQVVRLLRMKRPISLSLPLEDIYSRAFSPMTRREFLYFWQTGRKSEIVDEYIVGSGSREEVLYLIVEGTVSILRAGEEVVRIGRGDFIAESSDIIGGGPALIDARAIGTVRCISWDKDTLESLQKVSPEIVIKVQKIVGGYMTNKLRAALDE